MGEEAEEEEIFDVSEVFDELESMRKEMGVGHKEKAAPFAWNVLGGAWTMAHKAVAFDAFQAKATSEDGKQFARRFCLNITIRFALSVYGELPAKVLCEHWVRKMAFFYLLWEGSGSLDKFVFDPVDLEGFQEAEDFRQLAASAEGQLSRRIHDLRTMSPSKGR